MDERQEDEEEGRGRREDREGIGKKSAEGGKKKGGRERKGNKRKWRKGKSGR